MNQEVTALLGVGAGALATVGAAALAYLAARRQASDQGKVAHRNALRTERREAYTALLGAVEPLNPLSTRFMLTELESLPTPTSTAIQRAISDCDIAIHELSKAQTLIDMAGPDEASQASILVWGAASNLRSFLMDIQRGDISATCYREHREERMSEISYALLQFTRSVRIVLETAD